MLNRRDFLLAGGAGLTALAAAPTSVAKRQVFPLNRNWLYGGPTAEGATAPDFDDRRFERVTLPHTSRLLPWHSFDDESYQFVSIYRRHFRLPAELKGQRVLADFGGAMTAAAVTINGKRLGEYRGGYTLFVFELTPHLNWSGDNVLAVEVDSTERVDIPPFGGPIDYLTFGGIYREAALRVVPGICIENVFARPVDVLAPERRVEVRCYLNGLAGGHAPLTLTTELRDGNRVLKTVSQPIGSGGADFPDLTLDGIGEVELWDIDRPRLYDVVVRLSGTDLADEYRVRIGFREARFTEKGFFLNGRHLKLRGLNRHQTFPYTGGAMPARVQRRDAFILRKELKCNIVRTSHYPQSLHFLDACDEAGLLVFEEIPGWQFIGDKAWQDLAVRNVGEMIRRDWNHPSIILWGARINESRDNHDFYVRTNELAHRLDPSRQTGGVRNIYESELLEDVFTMNDFRFPLRPPNHPLYLNTEFNGHMFSTKHIDAVEHVIEHVLRHARVHNQLASDDRYAGGIGWCAFDYATHQNFGSGDRICYHGVSDVFRIPKPAAAVYKSQCDPKEEIVLEPGFAWSWGDKPAGNGPGLAPVLSNCDHVKVYIGGRLKAEADPDRQQFGNLPHPPFMVDLTGCRFDRWGDLKIEGYIGGKLVATRILSGKGADAQLLVEPDDAELAGDGSDATRVVLRVTDEYGSPRQFATGAVSLSIEGPGEIVGENPFALTGGVGAVWVKAKEAAGVIRLSARHPYLGAKTVEIRVKAVPPEGV
jgi:beta-galactosidase